MINTKKIAIAIAVVFVAMACLSFWLRQQSTENQIATVTVAGAVIEEIDLAKVRSPYEFTISGENGSNTIAVERGRISVSHADCPDQTCVNQGWLSDGVWPIVCLPHKMIITMTNQTQMDGVAL